MMRPPNDRDLYAYAANALEAGDALAVEQAVAVDATIRRRLTWIQERLDRLVAQDRWHIPRLTLPGRAPPLHVRVETALHMDERPPGERVVREGDLITLRIPSPGDASALRPVIVCESAGTTEVLHPAAQDDWLSLDKWPSGPDGYEIDVAVGGPPGAHRYIVALAGPDVQVDWSRGPSERWAGLRELIEEGRLPAAVSVIDVTGG